MIALRLTVLAAFALTFQSVYGDAGTGSSVVLDAMMQEFDKNGNKEIDFEEFKAVVENWGKNFSEDNIKTAFKMMDKDENQTIDREEFKQFIRQEPVLKGIFSSIDTNRDELINYDELTAYFKAVNIELTEEQLQEMFKECDSDADKAISFEEFKEKFIQ